MLFRSLSEGRTTELHKAIEAGQYYGMHSFDQDILRLFSLGKITKEEALDAATNPDDLQMQMNSSLKIEDGVQK